MLGVGHRSEGRTDGLGEGGREREGEIGRGSESEIETVKRMKLV